MFTYVSTQTESWLLKVTLPTSSFSILVLPSTILGCICMTILRSPFFYLTVILYFSLFLLSIGWWVESLSFSFGYCIVFPRASILSSNLLWRGFYMNNYDVILILMNKKLHIFLQWKKTINIEIFHHVSFYI